jgi:soluble epoxide hydrolase/lipid-phosphate phosphatase
VVAPGEAPTAYGWKAAADDMAELLSQLSIPRVILLGHDWGGAIVSRIYLYYPTLVSHIASVCTPYFPPSKTYMPIEDVVKVWPTFTYQIAFADPQTERDIAGPAELSRFFRAIHRGMGDGGPDFRVTKDFLETLGDWPRGKLLTERDLEYYVEQYSRNGMHGPCILPSPPPPQTPPS